MPKDETSSIEKRINDLEQIIVEMKERFEDMEDMIIIEQAAMTELQKAVEETKGISLEAPEAISADVEERLKKIESELASIVERKGGLEIQKVAGGPRIEKIEKKVKILEEDLRKSMVQKFSGMAKERDLATFRIKIDEVEKLVNSLEKRVEKLEGGRTEIKPMDISGKAKDGIAQKAAEVEKLAKTIEESNKMLSSKVLSEINALKEKIKVMDTSSGGKYKEDVEDLKSRLAKIIKDSKVGSTMNKQVNELLEKIDFLEKRLGSIEKKARKALRPKRWPWE